MRDQQISAVKSNGPKVEEKTKLRGTSKSQPLGSTVHQKLSKVPSYFGVWWLRLAAVRLAIRPGLWKWKELRDCKEAKTTEGHAFVEIKRESWLGLREFAAARPAGQVLRSGRDFEWLCDFSCDEFVDCAPSLFFTRHLHL